MAQDGKLTADTLVKAFGDAGPAMAEAMSKMPLTVSDIFEKLDRVTTKFGKDFMKAIFPDTNTAEFKQIVEDTFGILDKVLANIIDMTKVVVGVFKEIGGAIASVFEGVSKVYTSMTGVETSAKDIFKFFVALALPITSLVLYWDKIVAAIGRAKSAAMNFVEWMLEIDVKIADLFVTISEKTGIARAASAQSATEANQALAAWRLKTADINEEFESLEKIIRDVGDATKEIAEQDPWSKYFGDLRKLKEELNTIPEQIHILQGAMEEFKSNMKGTPEDLAYLKGMEDRLTALYAKLNSGDPTEAFRAGLQFLKKDLSIDDKIQILISEIAMLEAASNPANLKNLEALKEMLASLSKQKASAGGTNPWQSFVDGIKNFGKELDLVPKKIAYLQAELAKASAAGNLPMIAKLQKDIESLRQSLASGNPIETFRLSLENLGAGGVSAADKVNVITTAIFKLMDEAVTPENEARIKALKEALSGAKDAEAADQGLFAVAMRDVDKAMESASRAKEAYLQLKEALDGVNKTLQPELWARMNAELEKLRGQTQVVKTDMEKLGESITDAIASNASNAVNSFIDSIGTAKMSFASFATSVLKDIAKMIVQMLIMKPLMDSIKGLSIFGGAKANALGNPYPGGTSLPEGIYTQPTLFKFASGGTFGGSRTGLMGEAGPEAILPLHRGSGGKLGVAATPSNVQVNVYNEDKDAKVETAATTSPDGSVILDIRIAKKVNEMFAGGSMDKTMRSQYGLTRQPV